jgi:hypothetical protein
VFEAVNRCTRNRETDEQLCDDLWPLRVDTAVPKAARVTLNLFLGLASSASPTFAAGDAILAGQYVSAGKTLVEAQKEVAMLIRLTHKTTVC